MRQIPPMYLKDSYFLDIEKEINKLFYEIMYRPIIEALNLEPKELTNAGGIIADALTSGKIWYDGDKFHGTYNARISKELKRMGAVYNRPSKTWTLVGGLPPNLAAAQVQVKASYEGMQRRMLQTINTMDVKRIDGLSTIPDTYVGVIDDMGTDFAHTMKSIAIAPNVTQDMVARLASEWGMNLDKYIKDWTSENIIKLREAVQTNVFEGRRSGDMIKFIQDNYGVSTRKARFLARQETSLLLAKYRETRYDGLGITKYRWSTADAERVRPDHEILDGTVHTWDTPPIVNRKTGMRAHPSEDFGCRCVAIALIE
ncbi:MAG: hypothetical protein COB09_18875 [Thalassobium sp.]|nr:MAG: hypothetical protein COB09_18875 [Thalassobium sp.]